MILDIIIIVYVLFSVYDGIKRGFVDSFIRFAMSYIVFLLTLMFAGTARELMQPLYDSLGLDTLTILGPLLGFNVEATLTMFTFAVTFVVLYVVVANIAYRLIISPIIVKITNGLPLVGSVNKLLGALFEFASAIICTYVLIILFAFFKKDANDILETSFLAKHIISIADIYVIPVVRAFIDNLG